MLNHDNIIVLNICFHFILTKNVYIFQRTEHMSQNAHLIIHTDLNHFKVLMSSKNENSFHHQRKQLSREIQKSSSTIVQSSEKL